MYRADATRLQFASISVKVSLLSAILLFDKRPPGRDDFADAV